MFPRYTARWIVGLVLVGVTMGVAKQTISMQYCFVACGQAVVVSETAIKQVHA